VIDALTDGGRYVGMLGDGVNDVGALKDARLGIAQGSGTQISRSVADLVLVQDDFAVVPPMVAEGRQILRNVQRVAKLFLTKTAFTAVLGLVVGITTATYPLLPRQFTLAATVTIGVPAFVLALAPSTGPWRPEHFLSSVARFAITAGIPIGLGIAAGYFLARYGFRVGLAHSRTVATATVVVCGLAVVLQIESECAGRRRRIAVAGLSALMALLFVSALMIPFLRRFYELRPPTLASASAWAVGSAVGVGGMVVALRLFSGWVHGMHPADGQAAETDQADVA
jgi:cation-transporting P-type ATPase E